MSKILNCKICNEEFKVFGKREFTASYCSVKCMGIGNQAEKNVKCTFCDKLFHMKKSAIEKYKRSFGVYCSKECLTNDRKTKMLGDKNHQYGLKGPLNSSFKGVETANINHKNIDILVYFPEHPYADSNGRVLKHRLLVEQNYSLYNPIYFEVINNVKVLKRDIDVHHKNDNHDDNLISNLEPLTRLEHLKIHKKNKQILRDAKTGRITGVIKLDKLLENPEEDNQQPI